MIAVEPYLPLVHKIAKAMNRRMGGAGVPQSRHIRLEDFESAGYIGLLQAAAQFDVRVGASFAAFAYHRIRGAMIDDLRDNLPLHRRQWLEAKAGTGVGAYECPLSDELIDTLEARDCRTPEEAALQASELRRVRAVIAALPEWRSRRLLERFDRDESLKDVAAVFGVNESRASQLQTRAIRQVRQALSVQEDGVEKQTRRPAIPRARPRPRAGIDVGHTAADYLALRAKHAARLRELYPIPEFQHEARSSECR